MFLFILIIYIKTAKDALCTLFPRLNVCLNIYVDLCHGFPFSDKVHACPYSLRFFRCAQIYTFLMRNNMIFLKNKGLKAFIRG